MIRVAQSERFENILIQKLSIRLAGKLLDNVREQVVIRIAFRVSAGARLEIQRLLLEHRNKIARRVWEL